MASLPKVAFSATNPCHMFDMARAVAQEGFPCVYLSGYPRWRLAPAPGLEIVPLSFRTLVTYGLLRVNDRYRPSNNRLFAWQDAGFDRRAARHLDGIDLIEGMPGQCLQTFRAAKAKGVFTVLNHASGPVRQQLRMVQPEYERAGVKPEATQRFHEDYFAREAEEYSLADMHRAASSTVRDQLVAEGIPAGRIWCVPYGADTNLFQKSLAPVPGPFRIVFAGQLGLRKGLVYLLRALESLGSRPGWQVDLYGPVLRETEGDFAAYRGSIPVERRGPVSQRRLAEEFARASVVVLPSVEEAFGLAVVQALQVGAPCIVSDRVGARDLIQQRANGSVFESGNPEALAAELDWWAAHPKRVDEVYDWTRPARIFRQQVVEAFAQTK